MVILDTREKINVYAMHGGAWEHLEKELIAIGFSSDFSKAYIALYRKNLGPTNAKSALEHFDSAYTSLHF